MSQRPITLGQLLRRLASPPSASESYDRPFIASATEIAANASDDNPAQWVILHSVTDCDVRLIHSRPLAGGELAVQIPAPSGEILRVRVATADSEKKGELYESKGQFLQ